MAGYPGTPLPKKLGIKAGHKVCLLNAPGSVERSLSQQEDVRITHDLRLPPVDVVMLFVDRVAELEKRFSDIASKLHPQGGFWVVFKSKRGCDITEDMVRRIGLAAGMTNDKSVELDATTYGMRLVLRHEIQLAMMYRATPPVAPARRLRRPTSPALRAARAIARTASGGGSTLRRARARSAK